MLECSVLIVWIFFKNFPLDYCPLLVLFALLLVYFINRPNRYKPERPTIKTVNLSDVLSLILAASITIFIVVYPAINTTQHKLSYIAISMVNENIDESEHLAMVNDRIMFNRGIFLKSDFYGKTRSLGFYPASWHSTSAIIIKSIYPNIKVGVNSMLAYGLQKSFWFFILFYLCIRTSITTSEFIRKKKLDAALKILVVTLSSIIGCVFLVPIIEYGFYSFLPQLISAILTIPILFQICEERNKSDSFMTMSLLWVICLGGCLSWLLPIPALCITFLTLVIFSKHSKKHNNFLVRLYITIKRNILAFSMLLSAYTIQLFVMLSHKGYGSSTPLEGILAGGGITKYSTAFFLFMCLGLAFYIMLDLGRIKRDAPILLSMFIPMLFYCASIYALQIIIVGESRYYFYKLLDVLIILVLPFCIAGIVQAIEKTCSLTHYLVKLPLSVAIVAIFLCYVGIPAKTQAYMLGNRKISNEYSESLFYELKENLVEDSYFNKKYVFYYVPGIVHYDDNYLANTFARSNKPYSNCFRSTRSIIQSLPSIVGLLDRIYIDCVGYHGYSVEIITDKDHFETFSRKVIDKGMQKTVKIKSL